MTRKPSESEDEYFARIEFERRKKIEREKQQKLAEEERKRLRDLHYLKCPKCGMDLIEIDYKTIKGARGCGSTPGRSRRCQRWKNRWPTGSSGCSASSAASRKSLDAPINAGRGRRQAAIPRTGSRGGSSRFARALG